MFIMEKWKYIEKCMNIPNTKQFFILQKDLTKTIETKIQGTVSKIKKKFSLKQNQNPFPTDLLPGKFY